MLKAPDNSTDLIAPLANKSDGAGLWVAKGSCLRRILGIMYSILLQVIGFETHI
ncbi:MAG: hypothetical protein WAM14_17405 [Candidatus Nitrosopolaris sp.]